MTDKELDRFAEQEVSWLYYYGHRDTRTIDKYDDDKFYERIGSIGYTKRVTPLESRCPATYITADVPVLDASIDQLRAGSGPRNHEQNVYTPLEYVFANKIGRYKEFITQLKS